MNEETIKLALEFMKRVRLEGSEVPAFNKVVGELMNQLKETSTEVEEE